MNEKDNPYKHSKLRGVCVASCNWCISEEARKHGITDGLRMAAGIVQNFHKSGKAIGVDISVFGINELILAKAKEVEEGKG